MDSHHRPIGLLEGEGDGAASRRPFDLRARQQSRAVMMRPFPWSGCSPGAPSCGPRRADGGVRWNERVVDVVVELEERRLKLRVLTDLRTDRDQLAARIRDEVPMRRHVSDKQGPMGQPTRPRQRPTAG